jgi:spermidine synthase
VTPELAEIAQGSECRASFERRVLELLQQQIGFDAAFFLVRGLESRPTIAGLAEPVARRLVRRSDIYGAELLPVKQAALSRRGVAVDTDVLGWDRVRNARYHREIARTVGGKHSLMAYFPWHGQIIGAVMLGRSGGTFSSKELRAVEALLPGLGVARAAFGIAAGTATLPRPAGGGLGGLVARARGAHVLESRPSALGAVTVRDRGGFREMLAANGEAELVWTRTRVDDAATSGWPYVDLFHVAATLARRRERALFVGCGGAVSLHQFARVYPGIRMDLVESEPAVIDLARRWYSLDAIPHLAVHVADGSRFVAAAEAEVWDVAIVDAFDAREGVAPMGQAPFYRDLRQSLRPGGTMAVNVIGALDGEPLRRIVESVRSAFEDVRVLPVVGASEAYSPSDLRNVVIVARRADTWPRLEAC